MNLSNLCFSSCPSLWPLLYFWKSILQADYVLREDIDPLSNSNSCLNLFNFNRSPLDSNIMRREKILPYLFPYFLPTISESRLYFPFLGFFFFLLSLINFSMLFFPPPPSEYSCSKPLIALLRLFRIIPALRYPLWGVIKKNIHSVLNGIASSIYITILHIGCFIFSSSSCTLSSPLLYHSKISVVTAALDVYLHLSAVWMFVYFPARSSAQKYFYSSSLSLLISPPPQNIGK